MLLSDVEKMRVGACVRACVRVHVLATVKLRKEERKLLTGFQLQGTVVTFIWESWSIVLFHILHSKYSWVVVTKDDRVYISCIHIFPHKPYLRNEP